MAGEARDLAGVLLVGVAVAVRAGRRLRIGVVHLSGVASEAIGRAEGRGRVALVARGGHRREVHARVARRARVAAVRLLGARIDAVVTVFAGRRRRGLTAVVGAAAGIDDRDARLVAIQARLAVTGGAVVGQVAVREGDRVVAHRLVPEMAALAAGRARGGQGRGVLARHVARPALLAGVTLVERAVTERRAGGVGKRLAVVTGGAGGGAVVLPAVERRGRCGTQRQRRQRAGAQQQHGDRQDRLPTFVRYRTHLPAARRRRPCTPIAPAVIPARCTFDSTLADSTAWVNRIPTR